MSVMGRFHRVSVKNAVKAAGKFVMENKMFCLQLGLMAATVIMMQDATLASNGVEQGDAAYEAGTIKKESGNTIKAIEGPLNTMGQVMTGTVPKVIVTIGAAVGAASWAMNIENQITKTAMRVVGGGSIAAGAGSFLADTTGFILR